jgi:RNA polymerase sigma factor (sigma-70 family)
MTRFEPAGTTSLEVMVDERFEAKLLSIDARSDIEAALSLLPLRQRAVIVLRYYEDLSESEIAGVLGWPVGTVKSTTSRALDELRSSMSDRVDGAGESFLKTVPTTRGVSDERST